MKLRFKLLLLLVALTLLLMSNAFAIYTRSLGTGGEGRIIALDAPEVHYDIDFKILNRTTYPEGTSYVIEFEIIYYGPTPLHFWEFLFSVPEDAHVTQIFDAIYNLNEGIITVSNMDGFIPVLSGESFIFVITIMTIDPDFEPGDFVIDDTELEKVLRPRLHGELELYSVSGNTRTYNITISNTGDATALGWRMSLQTSGNFQFRSITENVNYIQQPGVFIISNVSESHEIAPGESVVITLVYNGQLEIEIIDVISQRDDSENTNRPRANLIAELNRESVSGNTVTYNITVTNTGNMAAVNWELAIQTSGNFRVRSIQPNLNFITQPNTLVISNPINTHRINPRDVLTIILEYNSNSSATPLEVMHMTSW